MTWLREMTWWRKFAELTELTEFVRGFTATLWESMQTLAPILLFFALFQILYLKMPRLFIIKVIRGLTISLIGLALFLFGVEYGFLPAGREMGIIAGSLSYNWILIPIGFALGFVVTLAEPAVKVLCYEIDKTSGGHIRENVVLYALAVGVAIAIALGMARIIYGFPIQYFLIPGYMLVLAGIKFSSSTFIAIAFDSGGVATGPMVTTFVVAIALGAAEVIKGRDPVMDGFGIIAMVALVPILIIMALGLYFDYKERN